MKTFSLGLRHAYAWIRNRWLESLMLALLAGVLVWFADAGLGLVPHPTPAPAPSAPSPSPSVPGTLPGPAATDATPGTPPARRQTPTAGPASSRIPSPTRPFDTALSYQAVLDQVAFGARPSGSQANRLTADYIAQSLRSSGWLVEFQDFTYRAVACRNVIAKAGQGPVQILGAHFDTRRQADNDPDVSRRGEPVLGADDGASGVAVLLGLARTLDRSLLTREVWLVFFDAEDNGGLDGWDWIVGSTYMADHLTVTPEAVIIVDMVGDSDQKIYKERNSTPALVDSMWTVADQLGYQKFFLPTYKWAMLDDHTPFLNKGLAAVDIIDFDYPYWHTTMDTVDKVEAASLERVGNVLRDYLAGLP